MKKRRNEEEEDDDNGETVAHVLDAGLRGAAMECTGIYKRWYDYGLSLYVKKRRGSTNQGIAGLKNLKKNS